jgi:methylmalonyl-CoA/ethylmalonyl-CoA epimerase
MKIDHVGIAVASLAEAKNFYQSLGLECGGEEEVPEQKVRVAFFPAGDSRIELLESTDPEGPIGKFLMKRGPGLHHLCIRVPDISKALADLKAGGYALIDQEPKVGAGECLVAFVHPKSTGGVLVELSQSGRPGEGENGSEG